MIGGRKLFIGTGMLLSILAWEGLDRNGGVLAQQAEPQEDAVPAPDIENEVELDLAALVELFLADPDLFIAENSPEVVSEVVALVVVSDPGAADEIIALANRQAGETAVIAIAEGLAKATVQLSAQGESDAAAAIIASVATLGSNALATGFTESVVVQSAEIAAEPIEDDVVPAEEIAPPAEPVAPIGTDAATGADAADAGGDGTSSNDPALDGASPSPGPDTGDGGLSSGDEDPPASPIQ
ncbi:hypothetical protein EV663_1308 [Rhodovulum bhavnagarense]|uniref:Uncharacterized protein n=1 Tax=Rhodovulum bhavnagarense TaxID=992286 RepID=A0A4R2RGT5_9RHOB|nr:hypothetical protein [Rhodovulum bhavnagarense]TCP58385.1 hypothetical protein EV663_1308 [Rhodovulum bhavnagarense]